MSPISRIFNAMRGRSKKTQATALPVHHDTIGKVSIGIAIADSSESSGDAAATKLRYMMPTVKFDAALVTHNVKSNLRKNIKRLTDFDETRFEEVYDAALRSVIAGGDRGSLAAAIERMNIPGITKGRAGHIAIILHSKANAIITKERQVSLGITQATWEYAGAACFADRKPSARDLRQDAAHAAAKGKRYDVAKGMYLNGKWTYPGWEESCRCSSRSVVRGLNAD